MHPYCPVPLLIGIVSLILVWTLPVLAEPINPACGGMLEQISKARQALVPFRRTLELARAHEYKANGEAAACIDDDHLKVNKPIRCQIFQWQPPKQTKYDLAEVDQYRQERKAFEDLFHQAKQICLLEP